MPMIKQRKLVPGCMLTLLLIASNILPASAQAINKIDSLTQLVASNPVDDDMKAKRLYELSARTIYADPKKSLAYIDQVLSFENKITLKTIVANSYRLKGIIQYLLSKYPEALVTLNTALRIDRQYKIPGGASADISNMAMVYLAQSNFQQALSYYQQAAKIYKDLPGQEKDATAVYANIGIIYMQLNKYDMALEHFEKALQIDKRINYPVGAAEAYGNIANVYSKRKNISKALEYCTLSLKLCDSIGYKVGSAREMGNLSSYYIELNKFDEAIKYGLKALELNKTLGNKKSIAFNGLNVAEAFRKKGNINQAKLFGLTALKISRDLKILEVESNVSEGLSQVYEKLSMPDSALFYYKRFASIRDSISSDQKKQELNTMVIQYDFDKKESAYQQQQLLSNGQFKQQQLQLVLNSVKLQKSMQQQQLQQAQLQNQKLQTQEKQKQLIISKNSEKLQANRVSALSQQQQLAKLQLNQLWLYGILSLVILLSLILFLLNFYRIRRLRFKGELERQTAAQQAQELVYRSKISESELKAIRSQMNPHFIFNVLNSIESYIMENDSVTAARLVQKFAGLSRLILENSTQSMVSADREWKSLKLYTELEAMRFNNQFAFKFEHSLGMELNKIMFPPMLIQPLIENAIHHGLRNYNKHDGMLSVVLTQFEGYLEFVITDNGVGLSKTKEKHHVTSFKQQSLAIKGIEERIDAINSAADAKIALFEISEVSNQDSSGTMARVRLPLIFHKGGN
jgi:sensor histidine kinase YesM